MFLQLLLSGGYSGYSLRCSWGGARYFEVALAPSRHLKWCIDKRWWQPICELIGELMKEEMPARWARPLPGGESAPPPSHLCQAESGRHPPPGVLLAHSCLCWCLACDPGVSVARKCVQHALLPPPLLAPDPNTFLQQLKISLLWSLKYKVKVNNSS